MMFSVSRWLVVWLWLNVRSVKNVRMSYSSRKIFPCRARLASGMPVMTGVPPLTPA